MRGERKINFLLGLSTPAGRRIEAVLLPPSGGWKISSLSVPANTTGWGWGGGVRVLPSVLIEKGWDGRSAPSSASLKPYRRGVVLVFVCNRVSISKIFFLFC